MPKSSELVLEAVKQMQVLSNKTSNALVTQSTSVAPLLNNVVVVPEEQNEGAQEQLRALIDSTSGRQRTSKPALAPTAEAIGKKLLDTVCLRSSCQQVDHVSVLQPVSVDSEDSDQDISASEAAEATSAEVDVDAEILLLEAQASCKNS